MTITVTFQRDVPVSRCRHCDHVWKLFVTFFLLRYERCKWLLTDLSNQACQSFFVTYTACKVTKCNSMYWCNNSRDPKKSGILFIHLPTVFHGRGHWMILGLFQAGEHPSWKANPSQGKYTHKYTDTHNLKEGDDGSEATGGNPHNLWRRDENQTPPLELWSNSMLPTEPPSIQCQNKELPF